MDMDNEERNTADNMPHISRGLIYWMLGLAVAFVIGMGAGYLIWARPLQARLDTVQQEAAKAAEVSAQAAQAANESGQQVKRYDVPVDDDVIRGNADAQITIIEFSDYQCPFCRQWHLEVLPQLQAKYGDQLRLVYRDFPLYNIHPEAEPAAIAANCAGEQEKYYEFGDLLFKYQASLSSSTYEQIAQELGLDVERFQQCAADDRHKMEVEADYNYASQLGVRSTPTFFINGLAVVGAQPFSVFEQIIDMELSGQIPK